MAGLQDYVKPPFASYDLVVYFGGGLFAIPFILRYVASPLGVPDPDFLTKESSQFVLDAIRVLTIVTFVYVLGHLVAYFSSQLIEKALDRFFGKMSTAILVSSASTKVNRNHNIREHMKSRTKVIRAENALFSSIVRGLFHLPNLPIYLVVYSLGIFGYFNTRLPLSSLELAEKAYSKHVEKEKFTADRQWFKPLEYFVINRMPNAVPRMYNYLIIAGLFRSLSFVFLCSAWWVIIYSILFLCFGTWPLSVGGTNAGLEVAFIEYLALSGLSAFCIMAYIKFQRRYAEEAILAFAYCPDSN